jgi:hypothetical protein
LTFDRGIQIEYLSPYSPDFNPIELCFSGMKAWFKRHDVEAELAWRDSFNPDRPKEMLAEMTRVVTPRNAFGWYCRASVL